MQRAAEELRRAGAEAVFLNGGGDVVVLGGDRPWRIGIQDPFRRVHVVAVVELDAGAVATSGRYERGGHVFDPVTRAPAVGLASVTVVDDDLGRADARSTAAFALGPKAVDWLRRVPGCRAYVVADDGTTTAIGFEPVSPPSGAAPPCAGDGSRRAPPSTGSSQVGAPRSRRPTRRGRR